MNRCTVFPFEGNGAVLKISQVSARLCVGHQTVLDWITRGVRSPGGGYRKLVASRVGRSWRVAPEDLEAFTIGSEEIEPPKSSVSLKTQKKIDAEVKEYWKVMERKRKLK
jgi:hypothetical protein